MPFLSCLAFSLLHGFFLMDISHPQAKEVTMKVDKVSQTKIRSVAILVQCFRCQLLLRHITSISRTSLSRVVPTSIVASTFSQTSPATFVSSSSTHRRLFQLKCWKEHWSEIGWKGKKDTLVDLLLDGLSIIIRSDTFSLTLDMGFTVPVCTLFVSLE